MSKSKTRRVVLQRPPGVDEYGTRTGDAGNYQAWYRSLGSYKSSGRVYPVVRLTPDGIDFGTKPGPGDEVGYGMDPFRTDDCLAPAIATVTQTPIEQCPSFDLDVQLKRGLSPEEISVNVWDRIVEWAAKRSLVLYQWQQVPVPRDRWIGVTPGSGEGGWPFVDHCLVMAYDRLIFDPACSVRVPPGSALMRYTPKDIYYGLSFEPKEE